jgi:serine/threonine protein kinase
MWELNDDQDILPVLLVEKADYGTLSELQEQSKLHVDERLELCLDVAKGLEALHGCGIAHCDVSLPRCIC